MLRGNTLRALFVLISVLGLSGGGRPARAGVGPYVSITNVSVEEGSSGRRRFSTDITSVSTGGADVEVTSFLAGSTADERDFVFAPVRLHLTDGQPQTISGEIIGDTDPEA